MNHATSYSASSLRGNVLNVNCGVIPHQPLPDVDPQPPRCPAGMSYIDRAYGESPSGGGAWLQLGRVNFPKGFQLDDRYRQKDTVDRAGGGAKTDWDGISNIPQGIHLSASGAHYWAVGVKAGGTDGLPDLVYTKDGNPKQLTIGMYCGPAGRPGPGCNVSVTVCAMPKRD